MISSTPPVPERNAILSFPTPRGRGDLLFFEFRDQRLPKNQHWVYGEAHPNSALYPHHELVFVSQQSENPGWSKWFYAAKREFQNLYNWTFSDADTWPTLTQVFVTKDKDFDPDAPIYSNVGGLIPVGDLRTVDQTLYPIPPADDVDLTGYAAISTTRREIRDPELASLYCEVVIVYEKVGLTLSGSELDEETGEIRAFFQNKVLAGTSGTTVGADGVYSEVRPINTLWSTKTTRRAAGLAGAISKTRTTNIVVDYYWPAVLNNSTPLDIRSATRKDGTIQRFIFPNYLKNAYNGPCWAQKIEEWSATVPAAILPDVLNPMPIVYAGLNENFSIPACLHGTVTVTETAGSSDPVWVSGTSITQVFPATTFATWPTSVVASFSVRRLYGGFLSQKIVVYSPV
jgi:hypothetical protein